MIKKEISYCGQKAIIACDEKCEKAWGINSRPRVQLDETNEDDWCYLSDMELGIAPKYPGTYEGRDSKPTFDEEKLNKWCCRECERCFLSNVDEYDEPITLTDLLDFSKRVFNIPRK